MRQCATNSVFFFFNDTATTEIYTLSLHDALPIWCNPEQSVRPRSLAFEATTTPAPTLVLHVVAPQATDRAIDQDRKSTRLNSSHLVISYAVFCLKKKKHNTSLNMTHTNKSHLPIR